MKRGYNELVALWLSNSKSAALVIPVALALGKAARLSKFKVRCGRVIRTEDRSHIYYLSKRSCTALRERSSIWLSIGVRAYDDDRAQAVRDKFRTRISVLCGRTFGCVLVLNFISYRLVRLNIPDVHVGIQEDDALPFH